MRYSGSVNLPLTRRARGGSPGERLGIFDLKPAGAGWALKGDRDPDQRLVRGLGPQEGILANRIRPPRPAWFDGDQSARRRVRRSPQFAYRFSERRVSTLMLQTRHFHCERSLNLDNLITYRT
jgi:hypothetical protein